jgi:uncharacterized Tic20 family protein
VAPNNLPPNNYSPNSVSNVPILTSEEKNWGMACHLSSLLGYVIAPSCHILGPLVVWLIKRNDSAFVDMQGKDSLNFHLSLTVYAIIGLLMFFTLILAIPAMILWALLWLMGTICSIIGAVKASNGETYQYPFSIRFLN